MNSAAPAMMTTLITAIVLLAAGVSEANTPTIRLFPTTVVEDLRQTGNECLAFLVAEKYRSDAADHLDHFGRDNAERLVQLFH